MVFCTTNVSIFLIIPQIACQKKKKGFNNRKTLFSLPSILKALATLMLLYNVPM